MERMLLSVVIPVYKVEKYMERCARSLFNQTLKDNIEFIFVNDASPDNSIAILKQVLEEFPERKSQVTIISLETNMGSAKGRPTGWTLARGEYIAHCDSDDWVEPEMYERMLEKAIATDADLVWCDYYDSTDEKDVCSEQSMNNTRESLLSHYLSGKRGAYVWNKIFKKNLITEGFINPLYDMTEDFVITIQLVLSTTSISYLPEPLYHHYINPLSITCNPSPEKIISNYKGIINNTMLVLTLLDKAGYSEYFKEEIICKKCSCKEILSILLDDKKYRRKWRETFKEINPFIIYNKFIPFRSKLKAFLILNYLWPICKIALLLSRSFK